MFRLHIKTDNAALGNGEDEPTDASQQKLDECARILCNTAVKLSDGHTVGKLYDINGNVVGEFKFEAS